MSTALLPETPVTAGRPATTDPNPHAPEAPKLTTTVPRELVHKAALAEVFLTGWRRTGADAFVVTAQWPRTHAFYGTSHGLYDPLLLTETIRQTIPFLSHVAYDVPIGNHLIWQNLSFALAPEKLRAAAVPAELELRVSCHDIVRRGNRLIGLRMEVAILREGDRLATADAHFTSHSSSVYRRLRGEYADIDTAYARALPPADPVEPWLVGHDGAHNVVLAPTERLDRWLLRSDTTHPILFDHPVDHSPGMLMLEAARQAAHAVVGPGFSVPAAMDCVFTKYAELDAPCWIEARAAGRDDEGRPLTEVTAEQNGASVFTARLTSHRVDG